MGEISKAVGQWIVGNVGWTVIIILFLLSCFFKIAKKEIDPLGWVISLIGKPLTKDVRNDIAKVQKDINEFKQDTKKQFDGIKTDRAASIKSLKDDYNAQIENLKNDIDSFEKSTNISLSEMKKGTDNNCRTLKKRLDAMEKSNDLQSIRQIRAHVLDFANSCMNKRRHSQSDFDNIFDENEKYEALCKKHKIKNHKYKSDYEFIEKAYKKCQEDNSFLGESEDNS